MDARFELVAVAFVRSVGGCIRVLLAIDHEGRQLYRGEPALLVEHHPDRPVAELVVEGATGIDDDTLALVHELAHAELAGLIAEGFDSTGQFVPERILGRSVTLDAPRGWFGR